MSQVELKMPKMGESVAEATITKWLKKEGDSVEQDEPILEIATDKVDSEVPSTTAGILVKQLYNEGDVVAVGKSIAIIGDSASSATPIPSAPKVEEIKIAPAPVLSTQPAATASMGVSSSKFYSPLVKNIAQQENVSSAELDAITGTGAEGRVTKKDILQFIENRKSGNGQIAKTTSAESVPSATIQHTKAPAAIPMTDGDVEIIEMDRMRKLIADHMVMSKHTSPHVTSFVEADVTNMVLWRNKVKNDFEKREKEKITFTPLFIEAIVRAIKDFPMINCSLDGTKILLKKNINIGMATALPSGNLIVPVIKNADRMNLVGLTKSVNDLSGRARKNKLSPDEIAGGTFTLTNVGTFGNVMGTPIINQPQVAILAAGAIRKKPAVIETEFGDTIGIRQMMFLSLSYDHRIVDGSLGGSFLRKIADYLEQFDINRNLL
ncbi:MAG TPA: dihydrolipoamide acetyltransferase family protein [Bacteroidia bacterium]|jgi:2-oxoglutarate dehydrogenase E2 component (dihydrolipoamide succinyltransferase)|nr:dihydrolipoamide acetyltransferase family protein [Bacteroidia bacterium]HMU19409.1 dihydrolipoamide acetyltransferase family protein [Bacteroidia bacterium]